ncbi:MAG: 30S ribosomal protein S16 [Candidatus Nealsonbacteria bacterium]|nr:30S ribosomal protein S16 [Candidatus Nealsonbacteria bacterium]
MLIIRFFRVGKKNQPSFKIVVTDKRRPPRAGRFTEQVGFYNPVTKERNLNKERIQYWVSKGAQPSLTAYNLFVKEGILQGKKIAVHKKSKKPTEAPASAVSVAAVAPATPAATSPAEQPAAAASTAPITETPKEGPVA